MQKFLFAALASLMFVGGAHAAQVAQCESGYVIKVIGGNKATCVQTQTVKDDVGPRKCLGDGVFSHDWDVDKGDFCKGKGIQSALVGPAKDCKLDYGVNAHNDLRVGRDRCYKNVQREVRGDISLRD